MSLQEESRLTDRYQTTVPSGVRRQLRLRKGDRIRYRADAGGRIYIEAARDDEGDPAMRAFLDLIQRDMEAHPEHIVALDGGLLDRMKSLVDHVEIDLDEPLPAEDE